MMGDPATAEYLRLVDHLVWMPNVSALRESVKAMPGLDAAGLDGAFATRLTELRDQGRDAEAELTGFVRELIAADAGTRSGLPASDSDLPAAGLTVHDLGELAAAADPYIRAGAARELGDHARALDELNASAETLERQGLSSFLARCLLLRGRVHEDLGRFEQGMADYEAAAGCAREVGDRPMLFMALNSEAASFLKRGLARESYRRFRGILRMVERWGAPQLVASTHNNLGNALLGLGRPAEAQIEFGKALRQKMNSADKRGEVIAFLGMGDALRDLGRPDEAMTWYGMALIPALEAGDVPGVVMYASRASALEEDAGDPDDVEELERTLDLAERTGHGPEADLLAMILARRYTARGDRGRALDLLGGRLAGRDLEVGQIRLHTEYCRLLAEAPGGYTEAVRMLHAAGEMLERELQATLLDARRAEIIGAHIAHYSLRIELLCDPRAASVAGREPPLVEAFELHEATKSRSFLSGLAGLAVEPPAGVPSDLAARESELLALERSYQEGEVPSEEYRIQRLGEIREDLLNVWNRMEATAPAYVRFRTARPVRFAEMQEWIENEGVAGPVFVSFFCDDTTTTAFALSGGDVQPEVCRFPIGRPEWEQVVRGLHRTFNGAPSEFPPHPPIAGNRPFARSLDFLYRAGVSVADFLASFTGARPLCIAPHGPLHLIPFHALRTSGDAFLASLVDIVYTPSLSTSAWTLSRGVTHAPSRPSVLVAGVSAAEDADPASFEEDALIFDPTRFELDCRLGAERATPQRILDELPRHPIVHLSCHGFFDPDDALESGLLLADGRRRPPRDPWAIPLLERSRFVLRARDVLPSRIPGSLITLNACSSGLQGQRNAGDEFEGFSRAFLMAGASALVLTLWNVHTHSSREFLARFYRHWLDPGEPLAKWQALSAVQREFLESDSEVHRHPYHWAPFTLTGDWR